MQPSAQWSTLCRATGGTTAVAIGDRCALRAPGRAVCLGSFFSLVLARNETETRSDIIWALPSTTRFDSPHQEERRRAAESGIVREYNCCVV